MKKILTLALMISLFSGFMPSKTECMEEPIASVLRGFTMVDTAKVGITTTALVMTNHFYNAAKQEKDVSQKCKYITYCMTSGITVALGILWICVWDKDPANWLSKS